MFGPQHNNQHDDRYNGLLDDYGNLRLRRTYAMMEAPSADESLSRSNTLQKGN